MSMRDACSARRYTDAAGPELGGMVGMADASTTLWLGKPSTFRSGPTTLPTPHAPTKWLPLIVELFTCSEAQHGV